MTTPNPSLAVTAAACPVCSHALAAPFFDGGRQPLATLGWPATESAARDMARHPHDFVQCPRCTHVWNRSFSYDCIPYEKNPNRMYNQGTIWRGHLAITREKLLSRLPAQPIVVDIGCGEGHFARGLAESRNGAGRFIGFDPNTTGEAGRGVEFFARYFDPLADIPALRPNALVMRHVLEHLTDPAAFVQQLAWGAAALGQDCWLFAEMPCIDRVFETGRLADFFYEHPSHFTTPSFRALMAQAGEIDEIAHGYDGEVVYALVKLGVSAPHRAQAARSAAFFETAQKSRERIRAQLDALAAGGKRIAIWGGTGKAAAFIHQFGADAARFPRVVDSDPEKVGTFVPGTGQRIEFRDALKASPVDTILIPAQWRARDIVAEIDREGIAVTEVLIEHDGALVDFHAAAHPYR